MLTHLWALAFFMKPHFNFSQMLSLTTSSPAHSPSRQAWLTAISESLHPSLPQVWLKTYSSSAHSSCSQPWPETYSLKPHLKGSHFLSLPQTEPESQSRSVQQS